LLRRDEKRIKKVFSLGVFFSAAKNLNRPVLDEIFLCNYTTIRRTCANGKEVVFTVLLWAQFY